MWKTIARFEIRYQRSQPLLPVAGLAFFAIGLALATSDAGTSGTSAPGTMLRNAPIVILRLMPVLSVLGSFIVAAFVASAALRDIERGSDMLFLTKPVTKLDFLGGRFCGALVGALGVQLAGVLGLMAGNIAPWQPADRLGAVSLAPYVTGLIQIVLPNLVIMGALFFALSIWGRRTSWTFLGVVFFIGMQDAVEVLAQRLERGVLGSLLEPSGIVAIEHTTRFWTVAEQNVRLPSLIGPLLANRLVWLAIAGSVLVAAGRRFQTMAGTKRAKVRLKPEPRTEDLAPVTHHGESPLGARVDPGPAPRGSSVRQLAIQARLEISEVVPRAPFLSLLAFGLMIVVAYSFVAGSHEGVPAHPLTSWMVQAIQAGARATLMAILVLYAGELVFSQRGLKISEVYDALPVPTWILLMAKVVALAAAMLVFLGAAVCCTVLTQLARGYLRIEPDLYARGLLVIGVPLMMVVALAVFVHALAGHKLVGLLATAGLLMCRFALPRLGFEDHLYRFGSHPKTVFSDLNGHGPHGEPFAWFMLYWGFGAILLLVAARLLWARGTDTSLRTRLRAVRHRVTRPVLATVVLASLGMVGVGGWIYAQTHERNEYFDGDRVRQRLADYEHRYRAYRDRPVPRIRSIDTEVDIYPRQGRVEVRGVYHLENAGPQPVTSIPITLSPRWVEGVLPVRGGVTLTEVRLPRHQVAVADAEVGFFVYELDQPLLPGENLELGFAVEVDHGAFSNDNQNFLVVENGTFFSGQSFLPSLGYAESNQLIDPTERRKRGLPPEDRVPDLDDEAARERNYLDADWIRFEAVVSTTSGQIALTTGDRVRDWIEGDRHFFHYRTVAPVVDLLPFVSGAYEVARDRWQDVDIEVYFHPAHAFNIERFLETAKASLAYMSEQFGAYPHRQLRIVEVPKYHGKVAFAFPQTIPFSESWSFTLNLEDAEIDWLSAILAHEIAHQWWNHQVVPGHVQGSTLIAESLSQYAAAMILQRLYGPEMVDRFRRFSRDLYHRGRSQERVREMPLARVENQSYLHYGKGTVAFLALEDAIGEDDLNRALRSFAERFAFAGPPYPTTTDLLDAVRQVVPEEHDGLIEDLFESITHFDLRPTDASVAHGADGEYQVIVAIAGRKLRDDGSGQEREMPLDDRVEIGVYDRGGSLLALEAHVLRSDRQTFTLSVGDPPSRVVVDPLGKLIERESADNSLPLVPPSDH